VPLASYGGLIDTEGAAHQDVYRVRHRRVGTIGTRYHQMDAPIPAGTLVRSLICTVHLGDSCTTLVPAELRYTSRDPYAVTLTFHSRCQSVPWTFARTLLSCGLTTRTGDGDVHTWPDVNDEGHPVVAIELCSREDRALVDVDVPDAVDFITGTYTIVAAGKESLHLDLDATIAAIRASASN
jgi:hypothetical protein